MINKLPFLIIIFIALLNPVMGQDIPAEQPDQDTTKLPAARLKKTLIGVGLANVAVMAGLNEVWYKEHPRQSFHFFNDSKDWLQMDKIGHSYSAFHLSQGGYHILRSMGLSDQKSNWIGSIAGFVLISQIELFDGFSAGYGASLSDLGANAFGAGLFFLQQSVWEEPRIYPKFSFQRSGMAHLRPELLGYNLYEEMIKDYNGQTYWLSFDLDALISSKIPGWCNIGLGYGVQNMIYSDPEKNFEIGMDPYRQYFLSLDLDLKDIKTNKKWLKYLIYGINMIHIPAPALEMSGRGLKFHWIYF
ncbi:MAG: DUF2279 domain-containing protein [Candidatus Cyclobacteriaceae bacterium M3_2C_046]